MATKIYTKTGDKGTTHLIGGTQVPKHHIRIESYGTLDELNSYIGLCHDLLTHGHLKSTLLEIQDRLFTIGSSLAVDPDKEPRMKIPDLLEADIHLLENEIDNMNLHLPEMKSFILPTGHPTISTIHVARCVCRRTERHISYLQENEYVHPLVLIYLNRLSDYLFTLARYVGQLLEVKDVPWTPRVK